MGTPEKTPEQSPDLLGYHLGLIDECDRAEVESRVGDPAALEAAGRAIERRLGPLAADEAPPAPSDLVRGILDRVEESRRTIPFPSSRTAETPAGMDAPAQGLSGFSMRELLGLAAAIALFLGIFVPGYRAAREAGQRVACMHNLGRVGRGYVAYAEANNSALPYAGGTQTNASWLVSGLSGDIAPRTNSPHMYQLVRGGNLDPESLICAGRPNDRPMAPSAIQSNDRFPDPRYNSYSSNLLDQPGRLSDFVAGMPIVSDMNPFFETSRPPRGAWPASNSRSHGRPGGQNVLRADISVRWTTSPNAGPGGDDIYRIAGLDEYTGFERPRSQTDAFLIP